MCNVFVEMYGVLASGMLNSSPRLFLLMMLGQIYILSQYKNDATVIITLFWGCLLICFGLDRLGVCFMRKNNYVFDSGEPVQKSLLYDGGLLAFLIQ